MKTLIGFVVLAITAPAVAGPDFTTRTPRGTPLSASDASRDIDPLEDVVFAHDSITLSESALAQIERAVPWLFKHPSHRVVIEGHADAVGWAIYNEDLATRRAEAVRQQLIAKFAKDYCLCVVLI